MDKQQKKVTEMKDGEKSEISYSVVSPATEATLVATEEKESEETMKGGSLQEIEDLEEVSDRVSDQIANKVAKKVLLKVADRINGSIKPSEMAPEPKAMSTFVPPPTNEKTIRHDGGQSTIKDIMFEKEEEEEENMEDEEGYESDDGMREV
jgi:hypothetical protein